MPSPKFSVQRYNCSLRVVYFMWLLRLAGLRYCLNPPMLQTLVKGGKYFSFNLKEIIFTQQLVFLPDFTFIYLHAVATPGSRRYTDRVREAVGLDGHSPYTPCSRKK